jgi:acyl-CoA synthetase (AMP-forming)/AMP-acid ligase II
VFPVEVETVLLQAENVREVAVHGAAHPLLGQVVHARVALEQPEDVVLLRERLRTFCMDRLSKSKVPVRLMVVPESELLSQRFKRVRQQGPEAHVAHGPEPVLSEANR